MPEEFYFELIRAWQTPTTMFSAGHGNNKKTWAKLLGITEDQFMQKFNAGEFKKWFKIMQTAFR
jgi:hypothetical protein